MNQAPTSIVMLAVQQDESTNPASESATLLAQQMVTSQSHRDVLSHRYREFVAGSRAAFPLGLSILPFIVVYGVLARAYGMSLFEAVAMMMLLFSGLQLVAAQMLIAGVPFLLIVAVGIILQARHLIYSASLAPYLRHLRFRWRIALAYVNTDEVFALGVNHFRYEENAQQGQLFLLGAGSIIWLADLLATLLGFILGSQVPEAWHLEFAAPLTFMAILVLSFTNRAGVCAALAAGLTALLAAALPLHLGPLVATAIGMIVGCLVEKMTLARKEVPQ